MATLLRLAPLRRLATPAQLARGMSTEQLAIFKAREEYWTELAPHLPESLKFFADEAKSMREKFEDFADRQPALVAEISKRKAANPDASGIIATTEESRDPATCKYTKEGTSAHNLMSKLFLYERFDTFLYDGLDFTIGDYEKAEVTKQYTEFIEATLGPIKQAMAENGSADTNITAPPLDLPEKIPYKTLLGL